jgi:hypothetical protein
LLQRVSLCLIRDHAGPLRHAITGDHIGQPAYEDQYGKKLPILGIIETRAVLWKIQDSGCIHEVYRSYFFSKNPPVMVWLNKLQLGEHAHQRSWI